MAAIFPRISQISTNEFMLYNTANKSGVKIKSGDCVNAGNTIVNANVEWVIAGTEAPGLRCMAGSRNIMITTPEGEMGTYSFGPNMTVYDNLDDVVVVKCKPTRGGKSRANRRQRSKRYRRTAKR